MFLLLLHKVQLVPPIFPRRVTPKHPSLFQGVKPRLLTSSRGSGKCLPPFPGIFDFASCYQAGFTSQVTTQTQDALPFSTVLSAPSASSDQPSSSLPSPACSPAPEGVEDGPPSGLHNKGVQEDPPRVPDLHDEGVQVDPQQQFHHRPSKLH
ncbi:hypothetical protein ATANTOWER_025903 [Ataeniobius toweri]|uniref:Uncharacterized protein n=1 Tax=Ataeniobius toweri TaxID=208326 RepID=A0ABU7CBR2_9TELE|nr:hypothetical protein [Ataeniobius toweri]